MVDDALVGVGVAVGAIEARGVGGVEVCRVNTFRTTCGGEDAAGVEVVRGAVALMVVARGCNGEGVVGQGLQPCDGVVAVAVEEGVIDVDGPWGTVVGLHVDADVGGAGLPPA